MELPRTRPRLAVLAIVSLVALGAAACGGGDSDTTALSGTDSSTTAAMPTTTSDLAVTTTLLLPTTTVPSTNPTPPSTSPAVISDTARENVQFRPVLAMEQCDDPQTREPAPGVDLLPAGDQEVCYLLGPVDAGADGNDIATAEAALDGSGQWLVSVTAKESSRGRLNAMFNACNAGGPTCPGMTEPGAVAIVVDGIVLSAPSVYAENLADDSFSISGDFSEAAARQLALVLNG